MSDLKDPVFKIDPVDADEYDPVEEALIELEEAAAVADADIVAALKTAASGPFEIYAKYGSELTEDERRHSTNSTYASPDGAVVLSSHPVERVVYRYAAVDDGGRPQHVSGVYPQRDLVVVKDVLLIFGVPAVSAYRSLVNEASAARSREWTAQSELKKHQPEELSKTHNALIKKLEDDHAKARAADEARMVAYMARIKRLESLMPQSLLADIDSVLATTPTPTTTGEGLLALMAAKAVPLGGRDPSCKFHGPDDYGPNSCSCAGGPLEVCKADNGTIGPEVCGVPRCHHPHDGCTGYFPLSRAT